MKKIVGSTLDLSTKAVPIEKYGLKTRVCYSTLENRKSFTEVLPPPP